MIQKQLWEENCSIMIEKDDFMSQYRELIIGQENNFIFINNKCKFSFNVNQWNLSTFDRNKSIKKGSAVKYIKIDKTYKIKSKIKDRNEVKKLENQYLWKPNKDKKPNEKIEIKFNKSKKK